MHVHFIRIAIQFRRQIFNRRLNEQHIRRAALRRLAVNLLRDFLQRPDVRIDPDVKLVRVPAGRLVYKAPVACPYVYNHSLAGKGR